MNNFANNFYLTRSKQKILVFGKSGQVGQALLESFSSNANFYAFDSKEADLGNEFQIRCLIQEIKPQLIINAAAYTAVDRAETEEVQAFKVNARGVQIIGEEAATIGAAVIHFSSDYVFDGTKKGAYVVTDKTNPLNVYGASKLLGEQLLINACKRSIVLRTSWIVSRYGNNFLKTILTFAHERDILRIVCDQYGAPTSAKLLAEISKILSEKLEKDPKHFPFGTYHVVPSGKTNWFDFAKFLILEAMKRGDSFKLDLEKIQAIRAEANPLLAKRPKNSRLDTSHFQKTFGITLPSWKVGILAIMDELYKD